MFFQISKSNINKFYMIYMILMILHGLFGALLTLDQTPAIIISGLQWLKFSYPTSQKIMVNVYVTLYFIQTFYRFEGSNRKELVRKTIALKI